MPSTFEISLESKVNKKFLFLVGMLRRNWRRMKELLLGDKGLWIILRKQNSLGSFQTFVSPLVTGWCACAEYRLGG